MNYEEKTSKLGFLKCQHFYIELDKKEKIRHRL